MNRLLDECMTKDHMEHKTLDDPQHIYAKDLLDQAQSLLNDPKVPLAMYLHVHYADAKIVRVKRVTEGFNLLQGIGAFECAKAELVTEIAGIKNETPNE